MEILKVKNVLKQKTMSLFSEEWYNLTSEAIEQLYLNEKKIGYVYFLRSENSSYIKVGKSQDIDRRIKELAFNHGKINLLGFIFNENYDLIEKNIHESLKEKRKFGEWFDLTIEEVKNLLEKHKGMFLNTDVSKISISDGNFEIKSLNENLQNEIFFKECDSFFVLNKRYCGNDLQEVFEHFNYSRKHITTSIKKWCVSKGYFYKHQSSNGLRYFTIIT